MGADKYNVSFRCYYPGRDSYTTHKQILPLSDVGKWVECYKFTHPECLKITVKIWLNKEGESA